MKDCIIVFDTNSYRQFASRASEEITKKHITDLKGLEKPRNIQAVLATDVALELYSHLDDLNDSEYDICKNSVIAQHLHTLHNNSPALILNSDVHLCNVVFGKMPEFSKNQQEKVLKMSGFLYNNSTPHHLEGYTKNFKEIKRFNLQKKNDFINRLKSFNNAVKDAHKIIEDGTSEEIEAAQRRLDITKEELSGDISIQKFAEGLLERATSTLGIDKKNLRKEEIEEKINIIRTQFLVPIIFIRNIYKSIFQNPYDFNLRDPEKGNSYWDYELSFQISNYVNGNEIIFVTFEKKFSTAAKEAGYENRVINLKNYLNEINYDTRFIK